jgi:hypothetical protein
MNEPKDVKEVLERCDGPVTDPERTAPDCCGFHRPGDILVVSLRDRATTAALASLSERLKGKFPTAGGVLIMEDGAKISVIFKEGEGP